MSINKEEIDDFKSTISLLKKALIIEKQKNEELYDTNQTYEIQVQKLSEVILKLEFNNNRLTSRVSQLMKEIEE